MIAPALPVAPVELYGCCRPQARFAGDPQCELCAQRRALRLQLDPGLRERFWGPLLSEDAYQAAKVPYETKVEP